MLFEPSADAAVTAHDMDVMVELPWMDLQRVAAVSAHTLTAGHWNHRWWISICA
ncbi:hypothetical protein ACVBII_03520 [Shewanella sp. 30m-15]